LVKKVHPAQIDRDSPDVQAPTTTTFFPSYSLAFV
jgi:hypothetical protein